MFPSGDAAQSLSAVSVRHLVFKTAEDREELRQSYALVRNAYLKKGYVSRYGGDESLEGAHETPPETRTFLAKKDDIVVMTLTVISDSASGLPMDEIYRTEMNVLRRCGRRMAELSGLASHEALSGKGMLVLLHLQKHAYLYAKSAGIDDFCIAINPRHASFYENVLLFEYLGAEKPYPRVSNFPACARRLDLHTFEERLEAGNKYFYRVLHGQSPRCSRIADAQMCVHTAETGSAGAVLSTM